MDELGDSHIEQLRAVKCKLSAVEKFTFYRFCELLFPMIIFLSVISYVYILKLHVYWVSISLNF